MKIARIAIMLIVGLACAIAVSAQTIQGTGKTFGSGWVSDGNGGYRGTGNNFGGGWH